LEEEKDTRTVLQFSGDFELVNFGFFGFYDVGEWAGPEDELNSVWNGGVEAEVSQEDVEGEGGRREKAEGYEEESERWKRDFGLGGAGGGRKERMGGNAAAHSQRSAAERTIAQAEGKICRQIWSLARDSWARGAAVLPPRSPSSFPLGI
jgi:hypothetical protein